MPTGYNASVIERALKRLETQGYLTMAGQGSKVVRVDGEDRKKMRVKDYGDPLTYLGRFVSYHKRDTVCQVQWKEVLTAVTV